MSLLLWSGGIDSTALLHQMLTHSEFLTDLPKDEEIRTISINHPQVSNDEENRRARDVLITKFKRMKLEFKHTEVTISIDGPNQIEVHGGIIQPQLWVAHAAMHLKKNEDLFAAYIHGDDVWHHREDLSRCFQSIQGLARSTGKLQLPFEWTQKEEPIQYVKSLGLLKHVWYCQTAVKDKAGKSKPCQNCASCINFNCAIWRIEQKRLYWNRQLKRSKKPKGHAIETEFTETDNPLTNKSRTTAERRR